MFDRLVKKYKGNVYVKCVSCWNQLLVMLWAQLPHRKCLRDLVSSLQAHFDKLYSNGIGKFISRDNIANANATRDVAIFRSLKERCYMDDLLSRYYGQMPKTENDNLQLKLFDL